MAVVIPNRDRLEEALRFMAISRGLRVDYYSEEVDEWLQALIEYNIKE